MRNNNHIVIMAGGVGSRFWPMSTPEYPKQFVDVLGRGMSMIQMTVERFAPLCPIENMWVVTSAAYEALVREQLPQLPVENILLEPAMRNTAPCIAYACWKIRQKNPSANVVVTPADALVVDVDDFRKVIGSALEFTAAGHRIVTVGIRPTRPETGYGYIEIAGQAGNDGGGSVNDGVANDGAGNDGGGSVNDGVANDGADNDGVGNDGVTNDGVGNDGADVTPDMIGTPLKVDSFKEKPALEVARQYLAAGNYLWNAGIFVWNIDTIVESLRAFVPELAAKMDIMSESFFTPSEREVVGDIFPTCEKISIDYAVMEKADYIYTIPGDFGWSDVGTWGSLWTLLSHDEDGNAVVGGNVHLNDCRGCIVHAPGAESVVLQGLEDSIVVERDGRLLVCKLSEEQRIKDFVK
jgi:mannose-1-phosphate guanylyltransferase